MAKLKIGSLFSGYGGLDLGVMEVFDAEVAWHCEWEDAPSAILDHNFPGVPNYRDVSKVDWSQVEPVDILTGGFPCQDVSLAGARRGLKDGTRSGLWSEFAKAIEVLKPRLVVIENVRGLLSANADGDVEHCPWCLGDNTNEHALRALGAVLGDLADIGFDAEWTGVRAADAGAPHNRYRIFIIAYPRGQRNGGGSYAPRGCKNWLSHNKTEISNFGRLQIDLPKTWNRKKIEHWQNIVGWRCPEPIIDSKVNPVFYEWLMGLPKGWISQVNISYKDKLKAAGNGVVPQQAVLALRYLLGKVNNG